MQSSNGGFPAWEPQRAYRWLEVTSPINLLIFPNLFQNHYVKLRTHSHIFVSYFCRSSTPQSSLKILLLRESKLSSAQQNICHGIGHICFLTLKPYCFIGTQSVLPQRFKVQHSLGNSIPNTVGWRQTVAFPRQFNTLKTYKNLMDHGNMFLFSHAYISYSVDSHHEILLDSLKFYSLFSYQS